MTDSTASTQIADLLSRLDRALSDRDLDAALSLFHEDSYWRDLVAFSWNIKTFEGADDIRSMLEARLHDVQPEHWTVDHPELAREDGVVCEGFIRFDTGVAHGFGYIRVRAGRIWTLLTAMEELKDHPEPIGFSRIHGGRHGRRQGDPTWTEERAAEQTVGETSEPYVLVIGGGQGGIMLGARLRQLDVPTVIIDKNERAGDNWRKRYKTLQLHNPIWENFFPYLDFPADWPEFMHKDKFAEWLEIYTRIMQLNYWGSTEAKSAQYDEKQGIWTVVVDRAGEQVTLHPRHVVLATGATGDGANVPDLPGQDVFEGVQQHSSEHPGPDGMEDKRVVVVGAGTSAHDIAAALALAGSDVTMVQRSSTHVVRMESFLKHQLSGLYSAEALAGGLTADRADIVSASIPFALFFDFQKPGVDEVRKVDADFYEALENIGFRLDFGPGDSGLFGKAITGAYNYYIEIGTSQLLIDGTIKLASGSELKELTQDSVILQDGRELPADVVIYATGFTSMMDTTAELMSSQVSEKIGTIWGLGSGGPKDPGPWEGEIRNMWKPTAQEGLWFQGSLIAHARFYSRFLALQLKARMEGIPTPVYGRVATERQPA